VTVLGGSLRDGSPPLAWGTHVDHLIMLILIRFTPTRVGNTVTAMPDFFRVSVHPHSRGEHSTNSGVTAMPLGSPPLAWGTHLVLHPGD